MTKLPSYSKPALTVGEQVKLLIERGLVCKDPQWHESAYPVNPTRVYSVLTILNAFVKKVAPQSGWKVRLFSLLADFPDIHRLSMAIPAGFEKSALWKEPDVEKGGDEGSEFDKADSPKPDPASGDSSTAAAPAQAAK